MTKIGDEFGQSPQHEEPQQQTQWQEAPAEGQSLSEAPEAGEQSAPSAPETDTASSAPTEDSNEAQSVEEQATASEPASDDEEGSYDGDHQFGSVGDAQPSGDGVSQ